MYLAWNGYRRMLLSIKMRYTYTRSGKGITVHHAKHVNKRQTSDVNVTFDWFIKNVCQPCQYRKTGIVKCYVFCCITLFALRRGMP